MDGIELLKKLSKNKETVKIIITGYPTTEHGNEAADYGADDFLVKPVQPQELLMAIEERLAKV
jgi:YesN/AraC family two-component response regulator